MFSASSQSNDTPIYKSTSLKEYDDNSPQSHPVLCLVTEEDTDLAVRQGCFSLLPLATSTSASDRSSGLIIHIDAQPPESARWHRQEHVCAIKGRCIR